jgi:hypothetical protein
MRLSKLVLGLAVAGCGLTVAPSPQAQLEDQQQQLPDPVPPPLPPKAPPEDIPPYEPIAPEDSDRPWGLSPDLLASLRQTTELYRQYARRFFCDENARHAEYGASGDIKKEHEDLYAYLLLRDPLGETVRELRQLKTKDGKVKGEAADAEPFPPAYAWVFLFSAFHEPYFDFRLLDTRFEGFAVVHEIQFRGSVPFTDGRDIRQWEGRVLVDAFAFTPVEVWAEPTGQRERFAAQYRAYTRATSILGFKLREPPLGFRANIRFGYSRDELSFPTHLRYDTERAVSPTQSVPVQASVRTYTNYQFTEVLTRPEKIEPIESP